MAQLLKLQDYVSRYEQDVYYYCSEYPTMKKQFWESTLERWKDCLELPPIEDDFLLEETPKWEFIKKIFRKNKSEDIEIDPIKPPTEDIFLITDQKLQSVRNMEELKQIFLDELLTIQLRWASSTSTQISPSNRKYKYDQFVRFFLQRFPDQYLFMHRPVVMVRNAPVELEMVLISPTQIYCISVVNRRSDSALIASKEKFWVEKYKDEEDKVLNPLIALNRSSKILQSCISDLEFEFPITKVLITPESYVDYPLPPTDLTVVDKRNFEEWFTKMRRPLSPVKYNQVKVAQNILGMCHVQARTRTEVVES